MSDDPVACSLSESELVERRQNVLAKLQSAILEAKEIPNGLAIRFAPEQLASLVQIIEFERQCCPFLTIRLTLVPQQGPIWLELTGPTGTREMLQTELGLG